MLTWFLHLGGRPPFFKTGVEPRLRFSQGFGHIGAQSRKIRAEHIIAGNQHMVTAGQAMFGKSFAN